jgi:hypothetical protein
MPSINPDAIPEEIHAVLVKLVEDHADPLTLAIEAWNASARYEQGERLDLHGA